MRLIHRAALVLGRDLHLGTILERLADVYGSRQLLDELDGVRRLTYRDASDLVLRWAAGLRLQVAPGDRVVVNVDNSYDVLLACVAVARAGAIPVPVNPQMRQAEIDHVIADSGATLVIGSDADLDGIARRGRGARVPEPPDIDPGATAAILYTSGTTGKPKGARLSHRSLLGQVTTGAALPTGLRRDEAVVGLPVAHLMGFETLLGLACAGVPVAFLRRFDARLVLDAIEERRATMFVGVPAMYRMLLEAGAEERDLRSVRIWMSSADAMPEDLARRFQRMGATVSLPVVGFSLGQAAFAEAYGMVETGGAVAAKISPPLLPLPLGRMLGVPLPGQRTRVVDDGGHDVPPGQVGELWVRGPGVLQGYHGDAAATQEALTADGWLRTGDLVRRGPFGSLVFEGRGKDVIKSGGYSVYALEVQQALEEHPDVLEAAVVGLADKRKGEVPAAAVRVRPGAKVTPDDVVAFGRERLASYKAPRRVLFVDELPRTGTRKVQRAEVRKLFEEEGVAS